jgi:hypothetical protein
VCFALPKKRAKLCDEQAIRDVSIYVVAHLARLPCQQAPGSNWGLLCAVRIKVLLQQ